MLPFTDYYSLEKYLQEIEYHLLTLPFFPPHPPKPCQLPQQQYSATVIDDAIRFVSSYTNNKSREEEVNSSSPSPSISNNYKDTKEGLAQVAPMV
jgi:hypothetical protein